LVGCQTDPLTLGAVSDPELAAPQIVWTGTYFAVGWASADGYQIRITSGRGISNVLSLPTMPASASPQLLWTGSGLKLYYALEDSIFVDTLSEIGQLAVADSQLVGIGSAAGGRGGFRAVMVEPDNVAVLTRDGIYSNGTKVQTQIYGIGAAGWNGQYFLYSDVLGHGAWSLNARNADGSYLDDAMTLQWNGSGGTGRGAGSYFASMASTRRHAVVVASGGLLTFALEGYPPFERELLEPEADVSSFWDGERYIVLLANGPTEDLGTANRDIALMAFTKDGAWLTDTETPIAISRFAEDERFPVGVGAGESEFGMAWIRDGELLVQRCAITTR